ncbi:adenosine deaminase [uncultured Massilia sp.]|uniref:adenosine deaminase n=1 Tax=uncultured Massilia sp. TaxID=169973 RepID=UPI0027D95E98|nr:adenosine deaminase [uncultured Massilia sp.]
MMQKTLVSSLLIALCATAAARTPAAGPNEAATARHYAALVAGTPKTAELTLFFTQMPKGGDLHHHYSGAVYAESYVDFLDKRGFCVDKKTYAIVTDKAAVEADRDKPAAARNCLTGAEVYADDGVYRELLQRWSTKDFHNHGAIQPPPDRAFFSTFSYFGPVADTGNFHDGLVEIKERAIRENVAYIETMYKLAPFVADAGFDTDAWKNVDDDAALNARMRAWMTALDRDPKFVATLSDFVAGIDKETAGIDDERFTMRYQLYVLRLLNPSQVFSSMVSAFKAAARGGRIVGVNIVGQESRMVPMRDYTLHMKMFRFLKSVYPDVKVAMHAGELALGDVRPEDLQYHIDQALNVAGANRIGHGIDLAHETNAPAIMKAMRAKDIPVEINLTSNGFISGIEGDNHPITLYRKYGVPYVISTDDAGVTRHTLSNEYVLFASRYKPNYADIKKTAYDSIRYSFLDKDAKARLVRQLDGRFARFEADIAALERTAVKH